MKAWELMYTEKVLDEGKKLVGDVKIIENYGRNITAEIEGFKVDTHILYGSASYLDCECSGMKPCKHEAGLSNYLEMHPELLSEDLNLRDMVKTIHYDDLRKFLLNEMYNNEEFKKKFLAEFKNKSLINKSYYKNKLNNIFKTGEGRDFEYHRIYDLNMMKNSLEEFLEKDIDKILTVGEYDFGCELLIKIGDLLDDENMSSQDPWEDLADSFMRYVFILSDSVCLDADKMEELHSKTGVITNIITVFSY